MAQQQNQILEYVRGAIEKIEASINGINTKIDNKVLEKQQELELRIKALETTLKIIIGILTAIGTSLIAIILKMMFPGLGK